MKIIRVYLLFFVVVVASSCKKDYNCECTNTNGTYTAGTIEATKSDARKYCASLSTDNTACGLQK